MGAALAFKENGGWTTKGIYLGRNKEVFDAEVFAIMQAVRLLDERGETGKTYRIFSDSQAAITRVQHDGCGPGQPLAKTTISMASILVNRNNNLTIHWTPSHAGVYGNELADQVAKRAAEEKEDRADPTYLAEASLSYLTRKTTEQRTQATSNWIRSRVGKQRRYRPPLGGKMRKGLAKTKKELASRYYQLLSGHAAIEEHLTRIGQATSSHCWWCGTGEKQTRHHLLIKCRRSKPEITRMWRRIRLECGWGGAPSIRRLFRDEKGVPAILEFLATTKVGKMPCQANWKEVRKSMSRTWRLFPYRYGMMKKMELG